MLCAICYYLCNLKNVQSTHTFTKSNTPPLVLSFFKNCINATISRNASHMIVVSFNDYASNIVLEDLDVF